MIPGFWPQTLTCLLNGKRLENASAEGLITAVTFAVVRAGSFGQGLSAKAANSASVCSLT